jgi:hypothetical protein
MRSLKQVALKVGNKPLVNRLSQFLPISPCKLSILTTKVVVYLLHTFKMKERKWSQKISWG